MSSVLSDIGSAMVHAREGTGHAVSRARSRFMDGVYVMSNLVGLLGGLDWNRGLGYFGLRRRNPMREYWMFGVGFVVGAGASLLFAPVAGYEARRILREKVSGDGRVGSKSDWKGELGQKAGSVKQAFRRAERKVEDRLARGAESFLDRVEARRGQEGYRSRQGEGIGYEGQQEGTSGSMSPREDVSSWGDFGSSPYPYSSGTTPSATPAQQGTQTGAQIGTQQNGPKPSDVKSTEPR